MHPSDCPPWEYKNAPDYQDALISAVKRELVALCNGEFDCKGHLGDTRPVHGRMFEGLTPPEHDYFAGHYRGEPHRCLQYLHVGVPGDPRVGALPGLVGDQMRQFGNIAKGSINGLDGGNLSPHAQISRADKLLSTVAAACRLYEMFLRIHPYANGNGHVARFCLTAILLRYGLRLRRFPIEPSPDPSHGQAITDYRNGNLGALEGFVLKCLKP